jgi:hypothetical protein
MRPCVRGRRFTGLISFRTMLRRVLCNVPTLGHHHSAEIYDDQSSLDGCYSEYRGI